MANKYIKIRGASEHNLKGINIDIPRDKFVVITGLSGSGKSSLAFDTMYAEGQRRYVESLSSYARMFLGQMHKPNVESIEGLSPAVSIDQKTTSKNPRSTVGTTTEIYDYLRLLFARVGIPHCPECGKVIKSQTTDQVTDAILAFNNEQEAPAKAIIMAPVYSGKKGEFTNFFKDLVKQGFSRVRIDGKITKLDGNEIRLNKQVKHFIDIVVDRVQLKVSSTGRIAEAVELATKLSDGRVLIHIIDKNSKNKDAQVNVSSGAKGGLSENEHIFSLDLACPEHGHSISELQPRDFSFNAPYGSCPECLGIGSKEEIEPDLVIPDPSLSIAEGCIVPFVSGNYYPQVLVAVCKHLGESEYTPWEKLKKKTRHKILYGINGEDVRVDYVTVDGRSTHWYIEWEGVCEAIKYRLKKAKSDKQREKYEKYFAHRKCEACHGKRLNPEILAVTVGGKNIYDITMMSSYDCYDFFDKIENFQKFSNAEKEIVGPIIKEIMSRLKFLIDVGLDYLTLERATATLSGGEAQRIRLATQIGAGLVGVLYILDEPSIGLHQRDNSRLISTLEHLRNIGNSVVVVEHDEETIRSADFVVDIGPRAGENGGEVVAYGTPKQIMKSSRSITGKYLKGEINIEIPKKRRTSSKKIVLSGVSQHNLQNVTLEVPLSTFTVVTGVSGSGKSSLITDTLSPVLSNRLNHAQKRTGKYKSIKGLENLDKVINIDQSPIGRTPRSNPATYIGLWDDIRALFASTPDSKIKGYAPGRFSFNVTGGRCEACKGDGQIKIEMHFLPDIYVKCEECDGKRYNRETLQVKYRGKTISDMLEMPVKEALDFFTNIPNIKRKLQTLYDVGLGYIRLGQPATTLSGGEAQRVKLASELQRVQTGKTFYILDEPTTGLHFEDVRQLLSVLNRLVENKNTVLVIEHNLDVIKCADHIIDLGPEGGSGGGKIIATGTPEEVSKNAKSYTGMYLKKIL